VAAGCRHASKGVVVTLRLWLFKGVGVVVGSGVVVCRAHALRREGGLITCDGDGEGGMG
jgi:hypothetical protein